MPKRKRNNRSTVSSGRGVTSLDNSNPGASKFIPNLRDLTLRPFGVHQSLRETLLFAYAPPFLTVPSTVYGETTFALNSALAPAFATAATGYVKYLQFYSKCFVLAARINIKGIVESGTGSAMTLGTTITTTFTSLANTETAIGSGYTDWTMTYLNPDRFEFNLGMDVAKFLQKPDVLDDPQLFSTASSPPSQLVIAHFWYQNLGTGTTSYIFYQPTIELDCVFTDPITFT